MIRGVRGATTIDADDPALMRDALQQLLSEIISRNKIRTVDISSVFFTVTHDIHAISPAKVARELLDWTHVPLMCFQEPDIQGLPERCIRILIQFETTRPQADVQSVYQGRAMILRPDLVSP
ncbi:MAG: chorismate mutase [Candidatus Melainabacteria bacterium]